MNIEIQDASVEARIHREMQATGAASAEEALLRLLNNAKIRRGIDQLDRGEGIPEDQLDGYLVKLKTQTE